MKRVVDFIDLLTIGLMALAVSATEVRIGEVSKEARTPGLSGGWTFLGAGS